VSTDVNPYAPPKAYVDDVSGPTSEAEAIRREHIKHEASIRSIGTLYYIGGAFMLLVGIAMVVVVDPTEPLLRPLGAFYLLLGTVSVVVAWGMRRLRKWAGGAAIGLSGISLLAFPVGTLVGAYILYLLLSAKGRRIFAADYADIVAATPHVKYRTSIAVWIGLGALLLMIALIAGIGVIAG
jgi:hypothetical protein